MQKLYRSAMILAAASSWAWAACATEAPPTSQPARVAFGDSAAAMTDERAGDSLKTATYGFMDFEGRAPGTPLPSTDPTPKPLPPEVAAQLKKAYETSIAGMEKQRDALDPTKDAEQRKQLDAAIEQTRKQMNDAVNGGANPAPAAKGRLLNIPAVGSRTLTAAEAIANLEKMLKEHESAQALSPVPNDLASAAGAALSRKPLAALAVLLRAHGLDPKDAGTLINLAAVADLLGLPRHALGVLDAAEQSGSRLTPTQRAALLTNRGHALALIGRAADAERALREAVALNPNVAAAKVNLAHALWRSGDAKKKEEAVAVLKTATQTAPAVTPSTPSDPKLTPKEIETETRAITDRRGRPSAYAVFDMSHGRQGRLPTVKIPHTIGEGAAIDPEVKKFQKEMADELTGIIFKLHALEDQMRQRERSGEISPASADRARDIFWYIMSSELEPSFRPMARTKFKAEFDLGNGSFGGQIDNPWASKELMEKQDKILETSKNFDATCHAMASVTEPYHERWQEPIHNLYNEVGLYFAREYPYMTALAANLHDPLHRQYAELLIRERSITRFEEFHQVLAVVTNWEWHFADSWRIPKPGEVTFRLEPANYPPPDACTALALGETMGGVKLTRQCEMVSVDRPKQDWTKDMSDLIDDTQFMLTVQGVGGPKLEGPPRGTGYGGTDDAGFSVAVDAKGQVVDFTSSPSADATSRSYLLTVSFSR